MGGKIQYIWLYESERRWSDVLWLGLAGSGMDVTTDINKNGKLEPEWGGCWKHTYCTLYREYKHIENAIAVWGGAGGLVARRKPQATSNNVDDGHGMLYVYDTNETPRRLIQLSWRSHAIPHRRMGWDIAALRILNDSLYTPRIPADLCAANAKSYWVRSLIIDSHSLTPSLTWFIYLLQYAATSRTWMTYDAHHFAGHWYPSNRCSYSKSKQSFLMTILIDAISNKRKFEETLLRL